jgi:hypothetical protein
MNLYHKFKINVKLKHKKLYTYRFKHNYQDQHRAYLSIFLTEAYPKVSPD